MDPAMVFCVNGTRTQWREDAPTDIRLRNKLVACVLSS